MQIFWSSKFGVQVPLVGTLNINPLMCLTSVQKGGNPYHRQVLHQTLFLSCNVYKRIVSLWQHENQMLIMCNNKTLVMQSYA